MQQHSDTQYRSLTNIHGHKVSNTIEQLFDPYNRLRHRHVTPGELVVHQLVTNSDSVRHAGILIIFQYC